MLVTNQRLGWSGSARHVGWSRCSWLVTDNVVDHLQMYYDPTDLLPTLQVQLSTQISTQVYTQTT